MTETLPRHGPYGSRRLTRDELLPAWLERWADHKERMMADRERD